MKRITRRIGVFGGTGSMMSALGGKTSVPAAPAAKQKSESPPAAEGPPAAEAPKKKKSWFGRLFGEDEEK
jgi:hypothetical protein